MELTNKTHSKPDLTYNMDENYKIDFISCLYDRNMINIIGNIFDNLSAACVANMRLVCIQYRDLIDSDRRTGRRLYRSQAWLHRTPLARAVVLQGGHMVTSLAANGQSVVFGLLGYDATVNIFDKKTLKMSARLVQSRDFPASISGLDYNDEIIVTCAYENMNGAGLNHAVYIWWLKQKCLASKITPHSKMIRSVRITSKYLFTASNDHTIAVMDITKPDQPKMIHKLTDHLDYVSCIDCDDLTMVSVSVDNVLKVWSLESFKCVYSFQTAFPTLKVAMSWPLATTGGQNKLLLWNIEKGFLIRELSLVTETNVLSALTMTLTPYGLRSKHCERVHQKPLGSTIHIAAGDNRGFICLWDTSSIIAGHPSPVPHRVLQIGNGGNMISSLAVDNESIISGDWSGQVLVWTFL